MTYGAGHRSGEQRGRPSGLIRLRSLSWQGFWLAGPELGEKSLLVREPLPGFLGELGGLLFGRCRPLLTLTVSPLRGGAVMWQTPARSGT